MVDIAADTTTTAVVEEFGNNGFTVGTFSGELETSGDRDWIKVELAAGETYKFYLSFLEEDSLTEGDANLILRDANGAIVTNNDDGGVGQNSLLTFTPSSDGVYFIDVGDVGNRVGDYSLVLAPTFGTTDKELTDGDDSGYMGLAGERILGGKGNDEIVLDAAQDAFGEQGNDTVTGNGLGNLLSGGIGNDTLAGGDGVDALFGDAGNDALYGGDKTDYLFGGAGNDRVYGNNDNDKLKGSGGEDILDGGAGDDVIEISGGDGLGDIWNGGDDTDTLHIDGADSVALSDFDAATSSLEIWDGNGSGVFGTGGANTFDFSGLTALAGLSFVDGGSGDDTMVGWSAADNLRGGTGRDALSAGAGDDVLTGGMQRDVLYGNAGRDFFDFNSIKESKKGGQRDVITDFQRGEDRIDLAGIDAKGGVRGNQKFKFIGKSDFHDRKGELRYEDKGSKVIVQGDVNGDGKADFEIFVKAGALSTGDFLL